MALCFALSLKSGKEHMLCMAVLINVERSGYID